MPTPLESIEIGPDQVRAVEFAALGCGRLAATVESAAGASSDILLIRHAVRAHDGDESLAAHLLLTQEGTAAEAVGAPTDSAARSNPSGILHAAIIAGTEVASSPANTDAQRRAALAGAVALVNGGILPAPWVAPWQLDAAARSAAVQIDRSGAWEEWIAAWCHLLAREATATERALRSASAQLDTERVAVRSQHRTGGTDADVLGWLHTHTTFTIRAAGEALELTPPTVGTAIERLETAGFATELTGQRRDRIWTSTTLLGLAASR